MQKNEIQLNISTELKPLPPAQELEFGKHFTDHWFHSKYTEGRGWHSSQVAKYAPMLIDPAASVLHYGQALFEGMKAFKQPGGGIALFRPEFNFRRLQVGAARLCLEAPPQEIFMSGLRELITADQRWVLPDEGCSLYIRPTLIGTEAFLGVRPAREILFYILLSPVRAYYAVKERPLRIWVETEDLRAAPGGLGAVKAGGNYASSLRAALLARKAGYDQVLWLDVDRQGIEEVGTMNVFFVLKDEIITPELNGSILPGGMRDSVLQMLRSAGKKVTERHITIEEVLDEHKAGNLVEAFGTGTAAVIAPIAELGYESETLMIGNSKAGPLSQWLSKSIKGIQYGTQPDTFGWMTALAEL